MHKWCSKLGKTCSRYERGEAVPMRAVVNLFKILDKHPELVKELV